LLDNKLQVPGSIYKLQTKNKLQHVLSKSNTSTDKVSWTST